MKKLGCLVVLLAVLAAIGVAGLSGRSDFFPFGREKGDGSIKIIAEGQPDDAMMKDVREATDAFNRTMEQVMGVRLQRGRNRGGLSKDSRAGI